MPNQNPHNPSQQPPISAGGATSNIHNQWIQTALNEQTVKLGSLDEKHENLRTELKEVSALLSDLKLIKSAGVILLGSLVWGGTQLYDMNKENGIHSTKLEAISKDLENADKSKEELMKKLDVLLANTEELKKSK